MAITLGPKINEIMVAGLIGDVYINQGNALLRAMQALVEPNVKSLGLNTPPGSPANGDTYIVGSSPTGAWAGHAQAITYWSTDNALVPAGEWEFYPPLKGWIVGNQADGLAYIFGGSTWAPVGGGAVGSLSIGSIVAAPATLNVSTEGTKDWVIPSPGNASLAINVPQAWRWKGGSGTAGTSAAMAISFRFISVSSAIFPSSGTGSGVPAVTAVAGDEACDVNDSFTAPNGSPTTGRPGYRSLGSVNYPGSPFGWSFLATSDGTSRTLNLYFDIGGNTSLDNSITATIFAHLLDGSAADVSSNATISGGTGGSSFKATITFKSATGTHLLVTGLITAATGTNPGCEIRFRAATVQ